jgi:hypothetical protein
MPLIPILSLALAQLMTTKAGAGDDCVKYRVSQDPSVGYTVAIQHVFQFPAAWVFQPTSPTGYTVPIQRVYQFPAAFVFQPGPGAPFLDGAGATYDWYGGPSFVPR